MAHPKSLPCHKSELDLFLAPQYQSSIERGQFIDFFPVSNINDGDVLLNDKLISSSTNTNPYRALFTTLLTYGTDAKTSRLQSELFYKDTAGKMDNVDPLATE